MIDALKRPLFSIFILLQFLITHRYSVVSGRIASFYLNIPQVVFQRLLIILVLEVKIGDVVERRVVQGINLKSLQIALDCFFFHVHVFVSYSQLVVDLCAIRVEFDVHEAPLNTGVVVAF